MEEMLGRAAERKVLRWSLLDCVRQGTRVLLLDIFFTHGTDELHDYPGQVILVKKVRLLHVWTTKCVLVCRSRGF